MSRILIGLVLFLITNTISLELFISKSSSTLGNWVGVIIFLASGYFLIAKPIKKALKESS